MGAGVSVCMSSGSRDAGTVGAIAPVEGHAGSPKMDGDSLIGGVGLPGSNKRALVRLLLRVGYPELSRKGGIANRARPAAGVNEEED